MHPRRHNKEDVGSSIVPGPTNEETKNVVASGTTELQSFVASHPKSLPKTRSVIKLGGVVMGGGC